MPSLPSLSLLPTYCTSSGWQKGATGKERADKLSTSNQATFLVFPSRGSPCISFSLTPSRGQKREVQRPRSQRFHTGNWLYSIVNGFFINNKSLKSKNLQWDLNRMSLHLFILLYSLYQCVLLKSHEDEDTHSRYSCVHVSICTLEQWLWPDIIQILLTILCKTKE